MSGIYHRFQLSSASKFNQTIPRTTNMSTQRFCLRWNNHQSNLLSVFDQLLHDESFVDVTLAVEGQLLRAHKMVLSACSPYFQALFINHPDKHPIVILKDVPFNDMKSLLDFMYRGEVSVDQDRLTHFLRVAESLRIKGLTEVNEEKCDNIANSLSQQQNSSNNIPNLQRIQQQQNKRLASSAQASSFNMLGNYLMQPKRKRGRPRRLSGNSNGDETEIKDNLVQGSPEMLEVKMGMDGFAENNSDGSTSKDEEENNGISNKVKEEVDEPIPGTSHQEGFNSERRNSDDLPIADDDLDFSLEENNQNYSNLSTFDEQIDIIPLKQQETVIISTEEARNMLNLEQIKVEPSDQLLECSKPEVSLLQLPIDTELSTGMHFLTDEELSKSEDNYEKKKWDFLEYMPQADGSVVCKRCGEVLASRTHWYRHKYKVHVNNLGSPSPLFKCEHCNVFFKSRKGYMGHYSTRHSEIDSIENSEHLTSFREENLPEVTLSPISPIPSHQANIVKKRLMVSSDKTVDWEEQRIKEEKLVVDIINRVKRECEAQGAGGSRRGYSRRTTSLMNINSQAC